MKLTRLRWLSRALLTPLTCAALAWALPGCNGGGESKTSEELKLAQRKQEEAEGRAREEQRRREDAERDQREAERSRNRWVIGAAFGILAALVVGVAMRYKLEHDRRRQSSDQREPDGPEAQGGSA